MSSLRQDDRYDLPNSALAIALASIGVLFVSDLATASVGQHLAPPQCFAYRFANSATLAWQDDSGRRLVVMAAMAGLGVVYLILLRFTADLIHEFGRTTRRKMLVWFVFGLVIGLFWEVWVDPHIGVGHDPAMTFLKAAIGGLNNAGGVSIFPDFERLEMAWRLIIMVAIGCVVIGGVSCLAATRDTGNQARRAHLAHQHDRLRGYVNLAAILMVTTTLFHFLWMLWPSMVLSDNEAQAYRSYINATTIQTGVSGSLVIVAFVAPVFATLSEQDRLLRKDDGGDAPDTDLIDKGLLDFLGKLFVVLAPALAGALPGLVSAVGNIK